MDEDLKVNSESLRNDKSQCSLDSLTGAIVDCAVRLHQAMGPGLLESIYEAVLARDLERRGFWVERQKVLSFCYDGLIFNDGFRLDLLVEKKVIVEIEVLPKS